MSKFVNDFGFIFVILLGGALVCAAFIYIFIKLINGLDVIFRKTEKRFSTTAAMTVLVFIMILIFSVVLAAMGIRS